MPMFRRPVMPIAPSAAPSAAMPPPSGLFGRLDQFRQQNPGALAQFGASMMGHSPMAPGLVQAAQMIQVNQQKNETAQYLLHKGLADNPEEAAMLASNPVLMQTLFKDNLIQDQFEARKKIAEQMGLDPKDQNTRDYMLSGQYAGGGTGSVATMTPQQRLVLGQQMGLKGPELTRYSLTGSMDSAASRGLNSTELKLKAAAEDALPALQTNIEALDQAEGLMGTDEAPTIYTGLGSETASRANVGLSGSLGIGIGLDPVKAQNTKQFNDLLSQQAISNMAETLKGATTNFELQEFKNILSDPSSPIKQRRAVIKRMRQLLVQKYQTYQTRVQQLSDTESGTVTPDQGGAMPGGTVPPAAGGVVDYQDWMKGNP